MPSCVAVCSFAKGEATMKNVLTLLLVLSMLISMVLVTVLNYVLSNLLVFRKKKTEKAQNADK